jgi:tRNA(Arg) A34 adenosine deaminase TadA
MKDPRLPAKGDILSELQLDDALYAIVKRALARGMIPIAGIISKLQSDGKHEVLGYGWNRLREGIPGIHGETGAVMNTGRLREGYGNVVATSSLSPCPFCQRTLACHLGVSAIRVLDWSNYTPDLKDYQAVGLRPTIKEHRGIVQLFKKWIAAKENQTIWSRDIGQWPRRCDPPVQRAGLSECRKGAIVDLLDDLAIIAAQSNEVPIGALVLDRFGEVIGADYAKIASHNDPSAVAAMSAWRACGARDHWRDKTLVLSAGPDHIAYSMFKVFNFGQLVVLSDAIFRGQLDAVRRLGVPVKVWAKRNCDKHLADWIKRSPIGTRREYLGVDYNRPP